MPVNKIALLEEFIKSKSSFKRKRYEELKFSQGGETEDYYWHLEDYRFESYHPFTPVFLKTPSLIANENYL